MLCKPGPSSPRYLKVLAVEPFDTPDGAQREGKSIAAGSAAVRLAGEGRRTARARRLQKARGRCREADKRLGQVQFARIVPTSIVLLFSSRSVRWRDGQLGGDFVEGILGRRETELTLEQRRLGRIPVRAGEIQSLCRVNELLCLLHYIGEVGEHGLCLFITRAWRRNVALVVSALAAVGGGGEHTKSCAAERN